MKTFTLDDHDIGLINYALSEQLWRAKEELSILKTIKIIGEAGILRTHLPASLQSMTPKELAEQVDPWISLVDHYESLIAEFTE